MSINKKLGIWMDHSEANLFSFQNDVLFTSNIKNDFDHAEMEKALNKGESLMHNKKEQHQAAYYNKLKVAIVDFDEVLLFGPTIAKNELFNILAADQKFNKTVFNIETTDKMTENEKHGFARDYFSK